MIYLLCRDYQNTANNHAGIKFLCQSLEKLDGSTFRSFVIPYFISGLTASKNKFIRRIEYRFACYRFGLATKRIVKQLLSIINESDTLFIMEYLDGEMLTVLAKDIKKRYPKLRIIGMAHLVPAKLSTIYPKDYDIVSASNNVDKIVTLGHSLSDYLITRGIPKEKIYTTFHYVDSYYYNESIIDSKNNIQVIAMGNQVRNITLLREIVTANPDVKFVICQGTVDMSELFKGIKNVDLIPFVPEVELRQYMADSDISLNVMEDTIGSNVIVTSMAMGLAMVCSDVGSIRDYCDEDNSILCDDNIASYNNAIRMLSGNREVLLRLRRNSFEKAKALSINNIAKVFQSL